MPRLDGIEATQRIHAAVHQCRVLVLTTYDVDENILAALHAGASGFLLKDTPRRSLIAAVRAVAEGDVLLDHGMTQRLINDHLRPRANPEAQRQLDRLTQRETEVLRVVARGLSNAEIAAELGVAVATIKTHIAKLLEKLAVRDRVQLAVLAHTTGLAPFPPRP
jgi:DNA-binding NarL/FixJ family response regulator